MTQEEVEEIVDRTPNELFTSRDISKFTKTSRKCIQTNLKSMRKYKMIGVINYKFKFYFYYSLKTEKFKNLGQETIILDSITYDKKECLRYLENKNLL